MTVDWTQIVATVIGGIIASGTGLLFERKREEKRLEQVRKLVKTAIRDDLEHSIALYEKIADEWEKTKIVWFATLNELRESRATYQNSKDLVVLFENSELRKRVFLYYLQSGYRVNNLEYQQRRKSEIEGRLSDVMRDLKFRSPDLPHESAFQTALGYMEKERLEYDWLLQSIPQNVDALKDCKSEAQKLLTAFEKAK